MYNVEQMAKAMALVSSERHGICFCQGTFASGGEADMSSAIKSVGKHIKYVHFRDGECAECVHAECMYVTKTNILAHFMDVCYLPYLHSHRTSASFRGGELVPNCMCGASIAHKLLLVQTFQDTGRTDMVASVKAYRDIGTSATSITQQAAPPHSLTCGSLLSCSPS
jgi:D-mannonate dehydratase